MGGLSQTKNTHISMKIIISSINYNQINIYSILCFRYITSDNLVSFGEHIRNNERSKQLKSGEDKYETDHHRFIALWSHHLDKNNTGLVKEMYGVSSINEFSTDEEAMKAVLKILSEKSMIATRTFHARDNITGKAPLLDMLVSDYNQSKGGFAYPSLDYLEDLQGLRTMSDASLRSGHEIVEITIGKSSKEDVKHALNFFKSNYEADQRKCPTNVVACEVHYIRLASEEMIDWPPINGRKTVHQPEEKTLFTKYPAKLILGGKNWSLSLRSDILTELPEATRTSKNKTSASIAYTINMTPIQPELLKFLENLPVVTGSNVKCSVDDMEKFIRELGVPEFTFKNGWIDIMAIATAAGFHSSDMSMFNLNFQILGGLLIKNNQSADGKWSIHFHELPKVFQYYLIGNIRSCYNMYTILFAATQRNFFPDPQICCTITECSQFRFTQWLSEFLLGVLKMLEVSPVAYKNAKTREELVCSLRVQEPIKKKNLYYVDPLASDSDLDVSLEMLTELSEEPSSFPGNLHHVPPERVVVMSKLIPKWPSVVFGSARFLHSTRWFCLSQMMILNDFEVSGVENIWQDQYLDENLLMEATYGQELKTFYPKCGSDVPGMIADYDLHYPVADIDCNHILNSSLTKLGKEQDRSPRMILNESLRLGDPEGYLVLIKRASEFGGIERTDRFWFSNLSKYEETRTSYFYITGSECSITCDWAERKIKKYAMNAANQASKECKDKEVELEIARKRMSAIEGLQLKGPECKRVCLNSALPPAVPKKQLTDAQRLRRIRKKKNAKLRKTGQLVCNNKQTTEECDESSYVNPPEMINMSGSEVNEDDAFMDCNVIEIDSEDDIVLEPVVEKDSATQETLEKSRESGCSQSSITEQNSETQSETRKETESYKVPEHNEMNRNCSSDAATSDAIRRYTAKVVGFAKSYNTVDNSVERDFNSLMEIHASMSSMMKAKHGPEWKAMYQKLKVLNEYVVTADQSQSRASANVIVNDDGSSSRRDAPDSSPRRDAPERVADRLGPDVRIDTGVRSQYKTIVKWLDDTPADEK